MNTNELFKELLEAYKKHRQTVAFDDKNAYEIYKWQLITATQGKSPIEIVRAHVNNPNKSVNGGFGNLIDAIRDNSVLKDLVNNKPTEFEKALNKLVDETVPLNDRLSEFKTTMKELLQGTNFNSKANDERTAAIILTCWNPKHYTFYKDSFYKKLCAYLGVPTVIAGKKYGHYLQLIQPLVKLIEQDTELKTIISNSAIANLLQSDLLLAQDICYELFDAFPNLLSTRTTMQNSKIQEYINLLRSTHNLILTGAPGTGKTYLARQIADAMGAEVEFVQFHPSYDYTDFVEGLRPIQDENGNVGFERKDGVFKEFCKKALLSQKVNAVDNFNEAWDKLVEVLNEKQYIEIPFLSNKSKSFRVELNEYGTGLANRTYPNDTYEQGGWISGQSKFFSKDQLYNIYRGLSGVPSGGHDNYRRAIVEEMKKSLGLKPYKEGNPETKSDKKFVFIIDEINRGEISKIFGELFFSIDPSYRGEEGRVQTQYQNLVEDGDVFKKGFYVPENVYIIGTMNDIDRSVESMDFAFRRRFAFKEIKADKNVGMLDQLGDLKTKAINRMKHLNAAIEKVEGLSSAYHIGASYFLKLNDYNGDFDKLWEYHLEGLLREYLRGMTNVDTKIKELQTAYDNESDPDNGQQQ